MWQQWNCKLIEANLPSACCVLQQNTVLWLHAAWLRNTNGSCVRYSWCSGLSSSLWKTAGVCWKNIPLGNELRRKTVWSVWGAWALLSGLCDILSWKQSHFIPQHPKCLWRNVCICVSCVCILSFLCKNSSKMATSGISDLILPAFVQPFFFVFTPCGATSN